MPGALISRTTTAIRYLYPGSGDAPWGTTDATGALTRRTVSLPGGAMMLAHASGPSPAPCPLFAHNRAQSNEVESSRTSLERPAVALLSISLAGVR